MSDLSAVSGLGVALACGLLIGLDREHNREDDDFGGIRTFSLIAIVGALSQMLTVTLGTWIVGFAFIGIVIWLGIYYYMQAAKGEVGLTSEAAGLVTFLLGVLAAQGHLALSFAIAIAVTAILALKRFLRQEVKKLTREDITATLKFLIVAFVVLPLLPNKTYTAEVPADLMPTWMPVEQWTMEIINPSKVGWMVVLIAGISFTGYIASKMLPAKRGLGLTAFLGGLASSTAVTLSFAGRAKETPALVETCAIAILVASTTMFVRVIVEVATVAPALVSAVVKPIGAMALAGLFICLFFWFKQSKADKGKEEEQLKLSNPFELSQALKFGALFAVVQFVAHAAQILFGDGGLYISGLVTGLTDVDAITLSVAQLTHSETNPVSHETAVLTITIASIANTVTKGFLAMSIGGKALGGRVLGAVGVIALVGVLVAWFTV